MSDALGFTQRQIGFAAHAWYDGALGTDGRYLDRVDRGCLAENRLMRGERPPGWTVKLELMHRRALPPPGKEWGPVIEDVDVSKLT